MQLQCTSSIRLGFKKTITVHSVKKENNSYYKTSKNNEVEIIDCYINENYTHPDNAKNDYFLDKRIYKTNLFEFVYLLGDEIKESRIYLPDFPENINNNNYEIFFDNISKDFEKDSDCYITYYTPSIISIYLEDNYSLDTNLGCLFKLHKNFFNYFFEYLKFIDLLNAAFNEHSTIEDDRVINIMYEVVRENTNDNLNFKEQNFVNLFQKFYLIGNKFLGKNMEFLEIYRNVIEKDINNLIDFFDLQ